MEIVLRKRADPVPTSNLPVLVAAAEAVEVADFQQSQELALTRQQWQARAWGYYDAVGEIHFPARYFGNAMSKIRLVAAEIVDNNDDNADSNNPDPVKQPVPTKNKAVQDAINKLKSPKGGQPGLLRSMALNLFVAAEFFLIGTTKPDGTQEWEAVSVDELWLQPGQPVPVRRRNPGDTPKPLPDNTLVVRVWNPHPRYSGLADGAIRTVLDECEKLLLLTRADKAAARSRFAGAGILFIPNELMPVSQQPAGTANNAVEASANPIYQNLVESMITPIKDESHPSGVVPITIFGPAEYGDKIRYITFDRPQAARAQQQREESITRIATALDLPAEILTGKADLNHWCVDDETEVLTADGWVHQDELVVGAEILTLNHETGAAEWQPTQDIYRAEVVHEPMVLLETRNHSSLTTPNHRWPVTRTRTRDGAEYLSREIVTTRELTAAHQITTGARSFDQPREQKYSDELVELVAWYWTEGSGVKPTQGISIAQSHGRNPQNVSRIRATLTRAFGEPVQRMWGSTEPEWREVRGEKTSGLGGPVTVFYLNRHASELIHSSAPNKRVALDFIRQLTPAQLELFILVSAMGDGQHFRRGSLDIWQRRTDALDAYELALILSGRSTYRHTGETEDYVNALRATTIRPIKATNQGSMHTRHETVNYTGTLWCPVTSNQTWLARRNGHVYYTGNTAWQVREETFQQHFQPMVELICDALTVGYLKPALAKAGIKSDEADKYIIWYDDSELVVRPDKGETAAQLYAENAIGAAAWRRETGFAETDAMGDDEYAKRVGLTVQDAKMAITGVPTEAPAPAAPAGPAGGDSPTVKDKLTPPEKNDPLKAQTQGTPDQPDKRKPPKPVTGSAGRRPRRVRTPIGQQLAQLDIELMTQLRTAASEVLVRELDRAGARIRSKTQGNREQKDLLANVPNHLVASVLGPSMVASLDLTDHELMKGAFSSFALRAAAIFAAAQLARTRLLQRRAAQRYEDLGESEPNFEDIYGPQDKSNRETALALLLSGLTSFAIGKLYDPAPDAVAPGAGEFDGMLVPASLVRQAVSAAGGSLISSDPGTYEPEDFGGIGTGATTYSMFADAGITVTGRRWVYGAAIRTPFNSHEDLDGLEFGTWDDEELAVRDEDAWLGTDYYHPGDHRGCLCAVAPITSLDNSPDE